MGIDNTHCNVLDKYFNGKNWFFRSTFPPFLRHDTATYLLLFSCVSFERIQKTGNEYPAVPFFSLSVFDKHEDSVGLERDPGPVSHPSFIVLSLFLD